MSREIKRVPLDFDWTINATWKGYKSPREHGTEECKSCVNRHGHATGYSRQGIAVAAVLDSTPSRVSEATQTDQAFLQALARASEKDDPTSAVDRRDAYAHGYYSFLGLDRTGASHDLVKHVQKTLGISLLCPDCNGEGFVITDAAQYAIAEAWEPTDPPTGPGWQVWETVSEGSPITPVYPTAEALIKGLCAVGTWADGRFSRKSAEAFVRAGSAPSAGAVDGGPLLDGVDFPLAVEEAAQKS